jgi:hypothetical protein
MSSVLLFPALAANLQQDTVLYKTICIKMYKSIIKLKR